MEHRPDSFKVTYDFIVQKSRCEFVLIDTVPLWSSGYLIVSSWGSSWGSHVSEVQFISGEKLQEFSPVGLRTNAVSKSERPF